MDHPSSVQWSMIKILTTQHMNETLYFVFLSSHSIQSMKVCSEGLYFQSQTRTLKFSFLSERLICVFFLLLNSNDENEKKEDSLWQSLIWSALKKLKHQMRLRLARQILNDSSSLVIDRKIVAKSLTFQINGRHKMHHWMIQFLLVHSRY